MAVCAITVFVSLPLPPLFSSFGSQCVAQGYDVLLTFDAEVNYIWRSKWSWVKVLFFLTRYSALVEAIIIIYREWVFECRWLYINIFCPSSIEHGDDTFKLFHFVQCHWL